MRSAVDRYAELCAGKGRAVGIDSQQISVCGHSGKCSLAFRRPFDRRADLLLNQGPYPPRPLVFSYRRPEMLDLHRLWDTRIAKCLDGLEELLVRVGASDGLFVDQGGLGACGCFAGLPLRAFSLYDVAAMYSAVRGSHAAFAANVTSALFTDADCEGAAVAEWAVVLVSRTLSVLSAADRCRFEVLWPKLPGRWCAKARTGSGDRYSTRAAPPARRDRLSISPST